MLSSSCNQLRKTMLYCLPSTTERRSNVKKNTEAHVVQESVEVKDNTARVALVSPYTVKFEYNVTDENHTLCKYSLTALVDSGSLIKKKYIPVELITSYDKDQSFTGINGSKLNIFGAILQEIRIHKISISILFYVVPNDTMSYPSILGRDFISLPNIEISFSNGLEIIEKDTNVYDNVNDINISVDIDCSSDLKMNEDFDFSVVSQGRLNAFLTLSIHANMDISSDKVIEGAWTLHQMDTTSNRHNAETWTQHRNELLDTLPKRDTTPKSVVGHIVQCGHKAEKQQIDAL
ncbi:hypothetical protein RN001_006698 [Aquatica leii]|uniref:Uncharacterized protein n=1 Tax=Aquatica leii TaxID=1421715 RepID=A0AAN7SJZ6_9COLE|nr:hypothetical protein RN001_006698 [Aquatica leii]